VKLFISLATPWGGDKMAEYGVEQSPAVIPSWIDMQPEGDFITSLYRKKIPEHVRFYMFYGHQGTRNPFSSNNDGTIALSSLLDSRPQAEAQMNYAFNEDHSSIISSKEVVEQYNTILNEFAEQQGNSPQQSAGGYLKVQVAYDYETEDAMPQPRLILHPVGRDGGEIVTFLQDEENSALLGPFPAGDYVANMVVEAGAPQEKNIPTSIKGKTTEELDFTFQADGEIRGCVTSSLQEEDKTVGMPDYLYRSVDKKVKIESLTLQGKGVRRELQQRVGEDVNNYDYLIERADLCYNTCFAFFGLPAGDYTLRLQAEGYKAITKKYSVVPGRIEYFRITELAPE
jgi:hypothetical protein